jgi:hypothetical protein
MSAADQLMELVTRKEELHEDLKPWIVNDGPLGPMLKHPLVQDFVFDQTRCARLNLTYAYKIEAVADALAKEEWRRYVFLRERPYRAAVLQELSEIISGEQYWTLAGDVWTDSENCWQYQEEWYEMLTVDPIGREFMSSEDVRSVFTLPPEKGGLLPETQIYRGFCHEDALDGYSWTLDRARAKWFANRAVWRSGEKETPMVASATVAREHVIAYITSRDEQEIVLLPEHAAIKGVETLPSS